METPKPTPEASTHVRPRETVEQMNVDAEREANRLRLHERLGGFAVAHTPEEPDAPSDELTGRLDG